MNNYCCRKLVVRKGSVTTLMREKFRFWEYHKKIKMDRISADFSKPVSSVSVQHSILLFHAHTHASTRTHTHTHTHTHAHAHSANRNEDLTTLHKVSFTVNRIHHLNPFILSFHLSWKANLYISRNTLFCCCYLRWVSGRNPYMWYQISHCPLNILEKFSVFRNFPSAV
jgi:hypothetical protein